MNRRIGLGFTSVAILALAATACNHGSSDNTSDAKAKAKAVASSTANVAVEKKVKKCVNATPTLKLATKGGRQELVGCIEKLVPPDQRQATEQCLFDTAFKLKVWHDAGRNEFMKTGAAACISKASASATPTPTPSHKKAKGNK